MMDRLTLLKRKLCESAIFRLQGHPPEKVRVCYSNPNATRVFVECGQCGQRGIYNDSGRVVQTVQIEFESCNHRTVKMVMAS